MQQTPIKYGIITGAATVLYLLLFYSMDKAQVLNPLVFWSALLLPMVGMVIATRKVKDEQGGEIGKKVAIKTSFLTWVIATAVFVLFIFVLFNYIDNSLIDIQKEMVENHTGKKLKREDLEMTLGKAFSLYPVLIFAGFLLAYSTALFLKSK